MKIVDVVCSVRANNFERSLKRMADDIQKRSDVARVKHEHAENVKAMKILKFGEYITLVPTCNLSRHYDRPLDESSAVFVGTADDDSSSFPVVVSESSSQEEKWGFVPGQQLEGDMIPQSSQEAESSSNESLRRRDDLLDSLRKMKASDHQPPGEEPPPSSSANSTATTEVSTDADSGHNSFSQTVEEEEDMDQGIEVVASEDLSDVFILDQSLSIDES